MDSVSAYQKLASRTECDQDKARHRMYGGQVSASYSRWGECEKPIRLNHAIIGALGELGELAGTLEKWVYYGQELDVANVKEELGDIIWYVALACNALGLDLGEVMESNIRKLKVRYPDKYSDYLAAEQNRDRAKEQQASTAGTPSLAGTPSSAPYPAANVISVDIAEEVEPCCECGCFYPRIHLIRDGHISCPDCRSGTSIQQLVKHRRTKKQVLEQRRCATVGCCSDWADMIRCNCLEEAEGTTGCTVCNNPNCAHPNEKH